MAYKDSINELRNARKKKEEEKNNTARQTTPSAVASRLSSVEELREQRAQQSKATSNRIKNTDKNRNTQTTQRKTTPTLADSQMIRDLAVQRMNQAQMGLLNVSSTSDDKSVSNSKPAEKANVDARNTAKTTLQTGEGLVSASYVDHLALQLLETPSEQLKFKTAAEAQLAIDVLESELEKLSTAEESYGLIKDPDIGKLASTVELEGKIEEIKPIAKQLEEAENRAFIDSGVYRDASFFGDAILNSINKGWDTAKLGVAYHYNDKGAIAAYENALKSDKYKYIPSNWFEKGVSGAAEQIGMWGESIFNWDTLGITGVTAGAVAALGQAGPQVALPEEVITVPAAAVVGLKAGTTKRAFEIEAGLAYKELIESGVSPDTAKLISYGTGTVNALLELVQVEEVLRASKILTKNPATKSIGVGLLKELGKRGIDLGVNVGFNVAQETVQEGVTIGGVQVGSKIDTGEFAYSTKEVVDRLLETAGSSALTFSFTSGASAVAGYTIETLSDIPRTKNDTKVRASADAVKSDPNRLTEMIEYGKTRGEGSTASEVAKRIEGKIQAGEEVTTDDVAELIIENTRAFVVENADKMNDEGAGPIENKPQDSEPTYAEDTSTKTTDDERVSTREEESDSDALILDAAREVTAREQESQINAQPIADEPAAGTGNQNRDTKADRTSVSREEERARVVTGYGENGIKMFLEERSRDGADDFIVKEEMDRPYHAGRFGISKDKVDLTTPLAQQAYNVGMQDRILDDAKSSEKAAEVSVWGKESGLIKNDASKSLPLSTQTVLDEFAKQQGMKFVMQDSVGGSNAIRMNGNGVVSLPTDTHTIVDTAISYALGEWIKSNSPEAWSAFRDLAVQLRAGDDRAYRAINRQRGMHYEHETGYSLAESIESPDGNAVIDSVEAADEIAMDLIKELFEDDYVQISKINEAVRETIAQEESSATNTGGMSLRKAWESVVGWLRKTAKQLKRSLNKPSIKNNSIAFDEMTDIVDRMEFCATALEEAFVENAKTVQAKREAGMVLDESSSKWSKATTHAAQQTKDSKTSRRDSQQTKKTKVDKRHKAVVYTEEASTFDWTNAPADITQEEKNLAEYIVKNMGVAGDFSGAEQAYNAFYDPDTGKTTFDAGFGISPELTKKLGNLDYLKKVEKLANERGQSFTFYLAHEIATHRAMDLAPREMRAFVNAMYEYKQGKTIGANLAREKTITYALRGKYLDTYTAMEEVVADAILDLYDGDVQAFADAIYRIGNSTNESAKKGMQTYFKWLGDFIEKLKEWARKLTGRENATLKANVEQSISEIENLRNMFEKAIGTSMETVAKARKKGKAVSVAPKTTLTETTSADGAVVMTDKNGDPVAMMQEDGSSQFSLKTYEESGRDALVEWLDKRVKEKKLTKEESADIVRQLDEFYEICGQFVDKYAPFGAWSDADVVKGKNGKPAFSVVKANGDYAMNLDFSLVCKKRRTLDAVFGEMINRGIMDDVELGEADIVRINDIIRESGFETACALCFVDSKRYRQASVADNFVNKYNELVEMLLPEGGDVSAHYFNYVGQAKANAGRGLHTLANADVSKGIQKLKQVMKDNGEKTVPHKIAKHLLAHPEDRKFVRRSDFMNTDGFEEVSIKNPNIMKLYNSSKGSGGPKAAFSDVQYLGEILSKTNFTPARAYAVGGVRIQSFSDYVPRLVFDYLQMIGDLSAKKLPAHAYTKEALFAMQFGMTGIKVNMSLVPAVVDGGVAPGLDANGDYAWFDGQSFGSDVNAKGSGKTGFDLAVKIQNANGYSANCGTIAVGISEAHIRKMLDDPNIRMIIPYHKSSLNHIVAVMNNIDQYEDFTGRQNTRYADTGTKLDPKKHKDFNYNEALRRTGDAKAAANEYLAWCKKNNYIPKFDQFAWHDNYYKLLEDFSTYDNGVSAPQGPVTMTFPKEGDAFGSMAQLIEQGLEEDAVLEGRREKSLPKIVDEIEGALKQKNTTTESGEKKYSFKYDYETLTAKPDMPLVTIDDTVQFGKTAADRRNIVQAGIKNATSVGKRDVNGAVSVFVDDIGVDVVVPKHGLQHGLDRRTQRNGAVTVRIGEILKNAIQINELTPKNPNASDSYILLSAAKGKGGDLYLVEFVVNRFDNSVESVDVLYSANTKKESAVLNAPAITENPLRITDSTISIAQILDIAREIFPDVLPESVLRHYGFDARPDGLLGESALYSLKGEKETFDEIIRIREEGKKAGKTEAEIQQEVNEFVGPQYAEMYNTYGKTNRTQSSRDSGGLHPHPERWTADRVGDADKTPMSLSDIIAKIRHDFGINITTGHVRGTGVRGQYNLGNKGIRTRIAQDLPTVAHELGHALDDRYSITRGLSDELKTELVDGMDEGFKAGYKESEWVSEGYAEFVRKFLQNRETAAIDYPEFTKHFLNSMSTKGMALVENLADEVNAYYSLDAGSAASSIKFREEGATDFRTVGEKIKAKADSLYQAWVDSLHGIKLFDEATGSSTYKLASNSAYADAVAGQVIISDLTDVNGRYVAPGLKTALHGLNLNDKKEYRLFGEYLAVKHGPERLKEGQRIFADDRKNSTAFMERRRAELEEQYPQFAEISDRLYAFERDFLQTWGVQTGLVSAESAKSWSKRWSFYVPLNRAVSMDKRETGAKRGFANQNSTIKKSRGSGLDIVHPVDNIINNIVKMVNAGMRNNVMRSITDAAKKFDADALFLEKVPTPMVRQGFDMSGVKSDLLGLLEGSDLSKAGKKEATQMVLSLDDILYQYGKGKAHGDVITVMRDGEQEFWKINDAMLLSSITNMEQKSMEGILDAYAVVSRFMTSNITGNNIVWALFSNFPRDLQTFFVYSKNKNPIKAFAAMGSAYANKVKGDKADPLYKEYLAMGGGQTSAYTADRDLAKRAREKLKGKNISANPIDWLSFMSNIIEAGPRFATYKLMRDAGLNPQEAFYEAMDITVNFRRGGRLARQTNKVVPFFNASVQGLDKFRRWITASDVHTSDRKKVVRGRMIAYLAVSASLAALTYGLNNSDDEDEKYYEQLSNHTKNSFWCFPMGDGKYFAIPKPRELGVLTSLFETSMEYGIGENDRAFDGFYDYATNNALPSFTADIAQGDLYGVVGNLGIVGTGAYMMANRDFLGRPIVSGSLQNLEPKDQYTERTSKIAYWVGQAFDVSPTMVDYFFNSTLGGWHKAQKALFPVGGENVDITLGVQNTYVKDNQYSQDLTNWLYDKADQSQKASNSDPNNLDKAIEKSMDSKMTSFYSQYNKLSKNLPETTSTRATRQTVLNMILEYQKASDNGYITKAQSIVYSICKKEGSTELLPSAVNTYVKDGNDKTRNLSAAQYVEYQTDYNRRYWEYVEDNITTSQSHAEKLAVLKAAKQTAEDAAKDQVLSRIGAPKTKFSSKFDGVNYDDIVTFRAGVDLADEDGLKQGEVEDIILDMIRDGLSKEDAYTLFHSRYESDKNNPWRWYK